MKNMNIILWHDSGGDNEDEISWTLAKQNCITLAFQWLVIGGWLLFVSKRCYWRTQLKSALIRFKEKQMENSHVHQNWIINTIYPEMQDLPISCGSVSIMIVFIFIFNTRIRISVGMATTCKSSKLVVFKHWTKNGKEFEAVHTHCYLKCLNILTYYILRWAQKFIYFNDVKFIAL
jgi:hypothetical protein